MKKVVQILALTLVSLIVIILLYGCGVSQGYLTRDELLEEYNRVSAQLRASEAQVIELKNEIRELKEQHEITGETAWETAQNIVKRYHETHIYSKYDFFVCSDMALDVWDMLKAQGIEALIQIGNVKNEASDITDADHAWVLAETSPGEYLALETTSGYAVSGNPLYYKGWSFDSPREYKRFVELKHEYEFRASLVKQLGEIYEVSRLASVEVGDELLSLGEEVEAMSVSDPRLSSKLAQVVEKSVELGEYRGRCDQMAELINEQNQQIANIISEMNGLFQ